MATLISMSSSTRTRDRGLKRATPLAPPSPWISSGASGSPESTVLASMATCTISSEPSASTRRTVALMRRSAGAPVATAASSKSSGRMPTTTRRPS